jgi:hypothetical protein
MARQSITKREGLSTPAEPKEGPHQVIKRSTVLLIAVTLLTLAIVQLLFAVISQVFADVPSLSVTV